MFSLDSLEGWADWVLVYLGHPLPITQINDFKPYESW